MAVYICGNSTLSLLWACYHVDNVTLLPLSIFHFLRDAVLRFSRGKCSIVNFSQDLYPSQANFPGLDSWPALTQFLMCFCNCAPPLSRICAAASSAWHSASLIDCDEAEEGWSMQIFTAQSSASHSYVRTYTATWCNGSMFDNQAGPACSVKILFPVLVMHCGLDYFYVQKCPHFRMRILVE